MQADPESTESFRRAARAIVEADAELGRDLIASLTSVAAIEGQVESAMPRRLRLLREALRLELASRRTRPTA